MTINSLEFAALGEVEQYFALARAYLEGSRRLSEWMLRPGDTSCYADTRVNLHLCRQAVELFLKGSIYGATGSKYSPTHEEGGPHNLQPLLAKYETVLPDPQFHFELPFNVEPLGDIQEDCDGVMSAQSYHKLLDQRHRYPGDRNGNLFTADFTIDAFMPALYLATLQRLAEVFSLVEEHLSIEAEKRQIASLPGVD